MALYVVLLQYIIYIIIFNILIFNRKLIYKIRLGPNPNHNPNIFYKTERRPFIAFSIIALIVIFNWSTGMFTSAKVRPNSLK